MSEEAIFVAESGVVRAKPGAKVRWVMTWEEAEELADFIERVTSEGDVGRQDVRALREGVKYARYGYAEVPR
jgi:hypothetical protein